MFISFDNYHQKSGVNFFSLSLPASQQIYPDHAQLRIAANSIAASAASASAALLCLLTDTTVYYLLASFFFFFFQTISLYASHGCCWTGCPFLQEETRKYLRTSFHLGLELNFDLTTWQQYVVVVVVLLQAQLVSMASSSHAGQLQLPTHLPIAKLAKLSQAKLHYTQLYRKKLWL